MPFVVLADPHGVPCPTCGARPLHPCVFLSRPKGDLVVHGRRTNAWFAEVVPVLAEREWVPFPEVETVAALEARRAAMRARHCVARRVTAYLLARHGLRSAVLDCVPCSGEAAPAIGAFS